MGQCPLGSVRGAVLIAALAFGVPRTGYARTCGADADCPSGFQCVPRAPGASSSCMSFRCSSDADCGSGLRCEFGVGTECIVMAGVESCHPRNICVPRWEAPCLADDDCGPGFTCTSTNNAYECGPGADAASAPPYTTAERIPCSQVAKPPMLSCIEDGGCTPPPPSVTLPQICQPGSTCVALTWKTCEETVTGSCSKDSDCPATWTCECAPQGGGVRLGPAPRDAGGACDRLCTPPNSDLANGGVGPISGGPALPGVSSPGASQSTGSVTTDAGTKPTADRTSSSGCAVRSAHRDAAPWFYALSFLGASLAIRRRARQGHR